MELSPDILPGTFSTSDAYRRSARRLRARFHQQPAKLQLALRDLVQSIDARHVRAVEVKRVKSRKSELSDTSPAFARQVALAFDGPILRYTQRLRLLAEADRLGVPRFQANLVIATMQRELNRG